MSEVKLGRVVPIYKGGYNETTAYNALDIVYYNGRSYMAKQDTKGNELPTGTDNDYWGLIADKGADGSDGKIGPIGPQGKQGTMGPAGDKGAAGKTPYLHIAYADIADGKDGFYNGTPNNLFLNSGNSGNSGKTTLPGGTPAILGTYSRTDSYEQVTPPTPDELFYRFTNPSVSNNLWGLVAGETYTISGQAVINEGTLGFRASVNTGAGWHSFFEQGTNGIYDLKATNRDGVTFTPFTYTFTVPTSATGIFLSLQAYDYTENTVFRFKNMKLEKGSIATDWTPNASEAKPKYMGTYTDYTRADSLDPTAYLWSQIKGDPGDPGSNVKWFGAVGNGVTDDTNAFILAYQDALNKKKNKIYIPSGSYVVNFKNMLINNFEVEGAGREQTFLLQQGVDPLFDVKSSSKIHNLAIKNLNSTTTTSIVVKNSDAIVAYYNIRLENLLFQGSETVGSESGQWVYTPILFDLNNKGLWDVIIDDVEALWVDKGVSIDTTNGGWLTGSLFNNIVVKGFSTFAVGVISSNNTLRQISQNVFSHLTAQVLKTALNAVGFVISGQGNDFNDLMLFKDGTYSGKAIQIKNYSSSSSYARPGWGYGNTSENTITGGTLEGAIDDPDGLIDLQHFNGVRLIAPDANGVTNMIIFSSNKHANLLSQGLISESLKENSTFILKQGTSIITGIDENGKFIQITNTANESYHYIPFPDTENTLSTLINKIFTVGVRYKKIRGSGVVLGTICFDESLNPDAPKYAFNNSALNRDTIEATWVFPANSTFLTPLMGKARRFDGVYFKVSPDSTVRIYSAFLSIGMWTSFNKLSSESLTNTLVDAGSRNFIKSPNDNISTGTITNTPGITKVFDVDVDLLNWQKRRNIVISADINVNNLNTDNVTSRLSIAVELEVTYSDGTLQNYNTGVGLLNKDVIEDRYSHFFTLPNKVITKAALTLMVSPGVSASSIFIGNPQVEKGSVAHDYIPYFPSN